MALNEQNRVRALLVDLDGVIRLWPRTDADLERSHGLPVGSLRRTAFEPKLIAEAIEGRISDEDWRETVRCRLLEECPNAAAAAAVKAWSASLGTVNGPVLDLVRRVREAVPVVLVANATSRLRGDLEALGLLAQFDAVVNSSVVRSAKPTTGIYLVALKAAEVEATEALFIDDQIVNVTAAAELGIRAHHFTACESLSACLVAAGLLHEAA